MNNEHNQQTCCWAIIPAAGTSQRMGVEKPKQYLPLHTTTVIETSIRGFIQHPKITGIVVALHKNDRFWQNLAVANHTKIEVVLGGSTRAESVKNALNKVQEKSSPNDFVLVHDAARPCLQYSDLDLLIKSLITDDTGGILAVPSHDTIKQAKKCEEGWVVNNTLVREKIWKALTPQMFRVEKLNQALEHCFTNNIDVTDEAGAMEALGFQVKLVEGRSDNIKITCKEDLKLAEYILENISG